MRYVIATKAGKLPIVDAVRALLVEHVVPKLIESKEEFYQGNGENLTIGQDSFFVDLLNDDESKAGRLMLSWSPNIWGPKVPKNGDSKAKGKGVEIEGYKLSQKDTTVLEAAIATMKGNGDIDNAVKLATIKSTYERVGSVTRDELKLIMSLQVE